MNYFARFEKIDGILFRFDTRIYLTDYDATKESICIGAVIGKNPGSAISDTSKNLSPLELNGDKMLPFVRNRFLDAYALSNKNIVKNSFVRVWNLFYICDADLNSACNKADSFNELPICSTEKEKMPIIWYVWGGFDSRLNKFKNRFLTSRSSQNFYYDKNKSIIQNNIPLENDFAKHTQGMPSDPINKFLTTIL